MAEYTSSWQSAAGAAEECQYLNFEEDLKMILFNIQGVPKKTHFQNSVGATVHWLNHK